ncbi:glutathione binding-like protein [Paraburkholderia phymatum]|uniref:Glutathione binding-like protein n=1 Tax=Paraburkholderia phymatum TaxID=148447 RepID=A0ACC6U6W2_9BURK
MRRRKPERFPPRQDRRAPFICDEQTHAEVRERARDTIAVSFTDIERKLGDGREYAALSGYSIADPMLLVLYRWGLRIDMPMQTGYPAWTALARRILSRPAVQRALNSEGLEFHV